MKNLLINSIAKKIKMKSFLQETKIYCGRYCTVIMVRVEDLWGGRDKNKKKKHKFSNNYLKLIQKTY